LSIVFGLLLGLTILTNSTRLGGSKLKGPAVKVAAWTAVGNPKVLLVINPRQSEIDLRFIKFLASIECIKTYESLYKAQYVRAIYKQVPLKAL
jgi:hypothetical protein